MTAKKKPTNQNLQSQDQIEYPEFKPLAQELADYLCRQINERAPAIPSHMPYKKQAVLEAVIEILKNRV